MMLVLIKKNFKVLLILVATMFSSSLYSSEIKSSCSEVFIQIPYLDTNLSEISYNDEKLIIQSTYPIAVSYLSTSTTGSSQELWNLSLKAKKDAATLLINLMEKSHLSFDDSIWVMVQFISKLEQKHQIELSNNMKAFLADILGVGDIFDSVSKIIRYNTSDEWISTLKYWSKSELDRTYWEFIELKTIVSEYLDLVSKKPGTDFKTLYSLDTQLRQSTNAESKVNFDESTLTFYKDIVKRVPRFRNISKIINYDGNTLIMMMIFGIRSHQEPLLFWQLYTEKLVEKTLGAIDKSITGAEKFIQFLSDRQTLSPFFKEQLSDFSVSTLGLLDFLYDLKGRVIRNMKPNLFKEMPYAHTASDTELLKYIRSQTANLFFPIEKMSEVPRYLVGALDQKLDFFFTALSSSYNMILKDSSSNQGLQTQRNIYFADFSYLTVNYKYQLFLIDRYGEDIITKLTSLISRDVDQKL